MNCVVLGEHPGDAEHPPEELSKEAEAEDAHSEFNGVKRSDWNFTDFELIPVQCGGWIMPLGAYRSPILGMSQCSY